MKKTFRMPLFCFLVIALILTVVACAEKPNIPSEEPTTEATTPEVTTPEPPKEPVPVDTLNGMTAKQLYEAFIEEYFSSAQFDIELAVEQTDGDGVVLASSIATKISENAVYYFLTVTDYMDEQPMEVWLIDDVAYVNSYGKKIKRENIGSIDEILDEGALDAVWGSFKQDLPQVYIDALEAAQLYFADDVYYYTITVPVENIEYDSVTETVYFNERGKMIGVTAIADGYYMQGIVNSYGEPIEILPPADADEYMPEFVPVDTLNGMNAAQLYEKFENEYKNSTSYEVQYDWTQSNEWWASSSSQTLKVNGNDFYYLIKGRYNETIEAWAIGDVAYVNRSGWEIKCARDNVDDVFGKGFYASLSPTLIQAASASYYAGLAETQLYFGDGVYFCTVSYFATEESTKQTTQTVFFDADGKLTKIVNDVNYPHLQIVVNYTAPVEVLPPEDALGYYEVPDIPKTEEEMYQLYVDACANLKNSQFLRANIHIPGVDYIDYKRYRENKHICISINSTSTKHWIFNQKGYTQIHWNKPTQTPIDDAFLSEFTAIENLFPLVPFEKEELKNFDCYYNLYTFETTIIFEQVDESGKLLQYEYTVSNDRDRLDVEITEFENGKRVETYLFNFEIDPENKINDPTK